MTRGTLLSKLDLVTDKAANFAIRDGVPIQSSKKGVYVGSTIIEKNNKGFYDISTIAGKLLYADISVFDVAVIVAQRYSNHEYGTIKKVLALEDTYAKNHTTMVYSLHCYKGAKKKMDYERQSILEDKFQTAEAKAKQARDKISFFKRVK